ncbi:hypothetical protein K503DRAFT_849711 [Rhizopogon vinicolor AM-OR11-026]|uniref:Uncharacterized protein n=1 Tax=Rhizopogon vinicolor AM-OR11-026 TaxID=1314800 RepID=A0A1B7N2I4_9AGAM|nr:hypothetical protein K503DRAFT_849711 [Rhizopogon vinicolor AM-OR11-026]
MADLTVLVSPTPFHPKPQSALGFSLNFARRSQPELNSSVMVTLETADPSSAPSSPVEVRTFDDALLSPPKRTSRRHRTQSSVSSQRSQSTPPTKVSFSEPVKPPPRRAFSTFPSTFTPTRELKRPPPPLFRPTTFWRKTKRSGVTGASYSPASHLVRRATFLAAGLSLDTPAADLSALGVESRVAVLVLGPDHILQLCPTVSR